MIWFINIGVKERKEGDKNPLLFSYSADFEGGRFLCIFDFLLYVNMKALFFSLAFVAMSAFGQTHFENDTHCQPALVVQETGDGAGTGFFVRDSVAWYLVTAKHLILDPKSGKLLSEKFNVLAWSHDLSNDDRANISLKVSMALDSGKIFQNTKDDVVAIELGKVKNGKEYLLSSYATLVSGSQAGMIRPVAINAYEDFKNVHLGDGVFLFGYPTALGLKPMPQFDYDKPLLKSGIIGGKFVERHSLVIDCPVFAGNCGTPVLRKTDGKMKLIGILVSNIPSFDPDLEANGGKRTEESIYKNNSGYGLVVPMDVVSELVKKKK
jgi:V8-like Glu-specific endopeptidase